MSTLPCALACTLSVTWPGVKPAPASSLPVASLIYVTRTAQMSSRTSSRLTAVGPESTPVSLASEGCQPPPSRQYSTRARYAPPAASPAPESTTLAMSLRSLPTAPASRVRVGASSVSAPSSAPVSTLSSVSPCCCAV